ncbi:sigma-70 family RNA polymerase sigma factor [Novosphingobium sp. RD2P27]|uniref:Sigma-70 family RNA polymerase sigma factor n=1 Tax=Novosphingobium kalidii TaxID=3230299 RepID=A0ABV2D5N8_9SPHN
MNDMSAVVNRRVAAAEEAELRRALYRFVTGRLNDRTEGEDIVQETYLRLYAYRRTRPILEAAPFCFAVARNLVADHFRRLRTRPPAAELAESIVCPMPRSEEVLDYRQRVDILVAALKVMPPLRREIFLRRRLDGVPGDTVAADLGMTRAAVDKHCTRALTDLRHALERRGLLPGNTA